MSSLPSGGAGGSGDKPPGFARFMRRASRVLKRGSSKRGSVSGLEGGTTGGPSTAPAEAIPEQPASGPPETAKPAAESEAAAPPTTTPSVPAAIQQSIRDLRPSNPRLAKTATESSAAQEQKARILFAKYGLTLSPDEWTRPVASDAQRVEKKVRVRIKRTCHRCQTTYGSDKVCNNCQHKRCKKCPRYPIKRVKEVQKKDEEGTDKALAVDPNPKQQLLSIRTRRTGQDLQYLDAKQGARRTCHRCNTLFESRATTCTNCKHERCPKCPRDPPKLDKWPSGYPGGPEETFPMAFRQRKKIRIRIRWKCHDCQTMFVAPDKVCAECGHERCNECPREPLKKNKPPPDEDLLRRVEERMLTMTLSPSASAA